MESLHSESLEASLAGLEDLEQAHLELGKQMFEAFGGAMYGMDLLAAGALNRSKAHIPGLTGRGILEITALSKGDEALGRRLAAFPSSATVIFKSVGSQDGRYVNHGYFAMALSFRGAGPRRYLDVAALGPALRTIRRHLE